MKLAPNVLPISLHFAFMVGFHLLAGRLSGHNAVALLCHGFALIVAYSTRHR